MHMADALISPAVGIAGWAGAAAVAAYAAAKLKKTATLEKTVPMMGVLGAFVFAAQMINFTIPGTGWWSVAINPVGTACGLSCADFGADRAGVVFRRWRPAGPGMQYPEHRGHFLLPGLPFNFQAARRPE